MQDTATARAHLKGATDSAHRRLDGGMAAFDLRVPDDYARFLAVNAAALLPVEAALRAGDVARLLPDLEERLRAPAILADLAGLGRRPPALTPAPVFADAATAMGAAYVLEGSRLGGRLLSRIATASPHAAVRGNMRFLRHGDGVPHWARFLARLEPALAHPADLARARAGALDTFARFQAALDRHIDQDRKADAL